MKISLLVKYYNDINKSFYSLQSAFNQKMADDNEYEIILYGDDLLTETIQLVRKQFPNIKFLNDSTPFGERMVFSNSNVLFSKYFLDSFCDLRWENNVVVNSNNVASNGYEKYIIIKPIKLKNKIFEITSVGSYKELIRILQYSKFITPPQQESTESFDQLYLPNNLSIANISITAEQMKLINGNINEFSTIIEVLNVKSVINKKAYSIYI